MEQPCDKTPQEQARESLIAIAYTSPNEFQTTDVSANKKDTPAGVTTANGDEDERLRSELISISYVQSPDVAVSKFPNGFYHG